MTVQFSGSWELGEGRVLASKLQRQTAVTSLFPGRW